MSLKDEMHKMIELCRREGDEVIATLRLEDWKLTVPPLQDAKGLSGSERVTRVVDAFVSTTTGAEFLTAYPSWAFSAGVGRRHNDPGIMRGGYTEASVTDAIPPDELARVTEAREVLRLHAEAEDRRGRSLHPGGNNLDVARGMGKFAWDMFLSLMRTQLVTTWTAFETLARDLWVAALNERPDLGFAVMGAEPAPSDDEDEAEKKRRLKYPFPVRLLRKWDYNLAGRMGTLLVERQNFARREAARDAYVRAFGPASKAPMRAVFDDPDVRALCAVRNAIVHNAGLADADFLQHTQGHSVFGPTPEGCPVPVDGIICGELTRAAHRGAEALVRFVDGRLSGGG